MSTFVPSLLAAPLWVSAAPAVLAFGALVLVGRVRWRSRVKLLTALAILAITLAAYRTRLPLRIAFACSQASFAAALDEARAAAWFSEQEPWQIGWFRIDRWGKGTHGSVFFETREWSLGLFDAMSYGIVYAPARNGRPYWGQGIIRGGSLDGAWSWYATNQ